MGRIVPEDVFFAEGAPDHDQEAAEANATAGEPMSSVCRRLM
jgi:hypothetical protein